MKTRSALIALLFGPSIAAMSASALAYTWDSGNCISGLQSSCTDLNPTPSGGPGVTYSAISDTGASIAGGASLAAAYVGGYGTHLGLTSAGGPNSKPTANTQETTNSPQHAMDNDGNSEFMLLSFAAPVTLSAVTLGWSQTDSDISVLAYTGVNPGSMLTNGTTTIGGAVDGLVTKGWQLIGSYANVCPTVNGSSQAILGCSNANGASGGAPASATQAINAGGLYSSYWLIGAYNTAFGTAGSDPGRSLTNLGVGSLDYVKLLSVAGTPRTGGLVPEPSSLLLAGVALLGLAEMRRRRAAV